jgi:ssRNA-specific RNase YbeY (16S rRNA maturation enzyme)
MYKIEVQFPTEIPKELGLSSEEVREVVDRSLKAFGLTSNLEIEILFSSKEKMKGLNKEHRGID